MRFVSAPGAPSPSAKRSSEIIGVTSAPEPQKNASSALYTSVRSISRSTTSTPSSSRMSWISVSRVMLSRMSAVIGGVTTRPCFTIMKQAAGPSATWPSPFSISAAP